MAAFYTLTDFQAYVFSGNPCFELVPLPSISCKVVEINIHTEPLITAQVTTLGFGVPAVSGSGFTDLRTFGAENLGPASGLQLASDWQLPPTSPTQFYRRVNMLGAAGNASRALFRWPQGLRLQPTQTYVLWCVTSAAKGNFIDFTITVES